MIQAKHLSIGSAVSLFGAENSICLVTSIHAMDAHTKKFLESGGMDVTDTHFVVVGEKGTIVLCSFLRPIKVTGNLLERLDFKKSKVGDIPVYSYWKKVAKLSLIHNTDTGDFLYDNPFYNCAFNYLHELQQLFQILNKEDLCLETLFAAGAEPSTNSVKLKKS